MIISHEKRFIFFACGKTGTTSIEDVLRKYHDAVDLEKSIDHALGLKRLSESKPYTLKHARPSFVKTMIPKECWDDYFKFVFVRNPWDWVLSQFCFNLKNLNQILHQFDAIHVDAIWHLLKIHNQSPFSEGYLQRDFIFNKRGDQIINFIGRYENLQDDFNKVCDKLGLEHHTLQHLNAGSKQRYYKNYYTKNGRTRVEKYYKDDIESLGYNF